MLEEVGLRVRGDPRRHQQGRAARTGVPRASIRTVRCRRSSIRMGLEGRKYGFLIPAPSCFTSAKRPGRLIGSPSEKGELLSWLFFIATGIGPFSGQAVHFQHAAPEKLSYAINRYRREVERHYEVLDLHLKEKDFIVGNEFSIADISAWGWLDRAPRVLPGEPAAIAAFPYLQRWFKAIDARPAVAKARAVGTDHAFKKEMDEETRRALFPSNYARALRWRAASYFSELMT